MMDWIYTAISWILLRWHQLWEAVLPGSGMFLGTTWPWILSIICLVITVRIILFPIFVKQIRSQRAMQALQPKMKELQTKHKGDQQTLREEMMKLYQSEKVNPLMGCLPMFLQIPVFLGLFHVLSRLDPVQSKNTTIYGWTQAEWDSAARAKLFGVSIAARFADGAKQLGILDSSGTAVKILAGVLVLIMMGTTFLTSRQMILKTGWNADPQQRMIQKLMLYGIPFSLLLSGWYFPIGVIIYWVTQNLFSLGQQFWVLHKYPPPVSATNIPIGRGATKSAVATKGATATKSAPAKKTAAASNGGGFVNPVQAESRSGLFRRKVETPPPAPEPAEARSTAPKPGAKPVNPKSGVSKAAGVKRTTPTRKSPANRKGGPRR
jgi:YidC/Oxa1 family membrane protein insertase